MSPNKQTVSRRWMVWIIAAFILPIVLAKLALNFDWFNKGATNKGHLITLQQTLPQMGLSNQQTDKHWLILYPGKGSCDARCEMTLYVINQTYVALGKEVERVKPVALYEQELTKQNKSHLRSALWVFDKRPHQMPTDIDQIYIVDPMGNFVLSYPPPRTEQESVKLSKAILSDLLKLLKYSNIG